jgi:DNA-binding transcriptional regulator YhcF (GntR family)
MRMWLSHSSEVPLREQLVTQIRLGVLSGDLQAGKKLPSTREIARRFRVHANTVSAAYRELHRMGLVEFRRGSGVYVRKLEGEEKLNGSVKLDQLAAQFFKAARDRGFLLSDIKSSLSHWLNVQPPDHFLVIEPDVELRQILMAEIEAATGTRVCGSSLDEFREGAMLTGAALVAMYSQAEAVRQILTPGVECLYLHSTSVVERLKGEQPPAPEALIVVVSRWPNFLKSARAILIAAGLDPCALGFRDARRSNWKKGLRAAALVITDSLMANYLPARCAVRVFRVISDASIAELRAFAQQGFC